MIKRLVIIGHTGFIGSRIERFLRQSYPALEIIGKSFPTFDLCREAAALQPSFDGHTAVIMLAGVKKQVGDTLEICQQNLALIASLGQVLEEHPVQRLIYFSSAEVYGENTHDLAITEDTAVQPTSYYGIAKYASERILQKVMPQGLVILRPPQVYGPGDLPCYGPSGFLDAALHHRPLTLWGDGLEKREFIFVDDVVRVVGKLLFLNYEGILNLASGNSYTYREILEIMESAHSLSTIVSSRERTKPKADHQFNNHKIKVLFPDFTFTSLPQGIQKMVGADSSREEHHD